MPDPQPLLAADALFAAFLGCVVLALTLGANLYPIATLLPLVVAMNAILTAYIVARHHGHIAWDLLLRRILPAMTVGVAIGYALFVYVPEALMKRMLGIFVLAFAAVELRRMARPAPRRRRPVSAATFTGTSLAAGIVHGMTATGGPVLVWALNRQGLGKSAFRSTLACVWLPLNFGLIVAYAASGRLGGHNGAYVAAQIPVIAAGVLLGEWLHHRLDERTFRVAVLVLLLLAGLALLA